MSTTEPFEELMHPLDVIAIEGANDPRIRTAIAHTFRRIRERSSQDAWQGEGFPSITPEMSVDLVVTYDHRERLHVYRAFPGEPPPPMTYSAEHQGYFIERITV